MDRLTLKRGRLGQETTDNTHPTSPIAFGPWSQALLSQSTVLTVGLVGQVESPLGKLILLPDFTQPEARSGRTAQLAILLPHKGFPGNLTMDSASISGQLPRTILW